MSSFNTNFNTINNNLLRNAYSGERALGTQIVKDHGAALGLKIASPGTVKTGLSTDGSSLSLTTDSGATYSAGLTSGLGRNSYTIGLSPGINAATGAINLTPAMGKNTVVMGLMSNYTTGGFPSIGAVTNKKS